MIIDEAAMRNLYRGIWRARAQVDAAARERQPRLHPKWDIYAPSNRQLEVWDRTYEWKLEWLRYGELLRDCISSGTGAQARLEGKDVEKVTATVNPPPYSSRSCRDHNTSRQNKRR